MSHESLAGVEEDLTAFDNHALDGQVFPDVLCLADLVVHYPGDREVRGGLPRCSGRPGGVSGQTWEGSLAPDPQVEPHSGGEQAVTEPCGVLGTSQARFCCILTAPGSSVLISEKEKGLQRRKQMGLI